MSLLQNPDFESGFLPPWKPQSGSSDTIQLKVINNTDNARTGSHYLRFKTSAEQGSVSQDIHVNVPSVTALAYVRAESDDVSGSLTIWDSPDTPGQTKISCPFKVGLTWTQIVAVLGRKTPTTNGTVRIELYLDTTQKFIWIDSVAAF